MKIIVINKLIRDKIRGSWKKHKGRTFEALEPLEVVKDTWYISSFDAIKRIKSKLVNSKYAELIKANVKVFTVGDGSNIDIKYQEYLNNQRLEN